MTCTQARAQVQRQAVRETDQLADWLQQDSGLPDLGDYGADPDTLAPDSSSAPQPPTLPERRTTPPDNDATSAREYLDLLGRLGYAKDTTKHEQLHKPAERWSGTPGADSITPPPAEDPREIACDTDGQPLLAVPSVQEYN
ncbi:hypothetical protein ACIBBB_33265 [Streptomyces sp. NPDC051217]|uniref:hypothetical protein n=1 Tax=Streptomyces sp. NPDC051217 TaxID=3365644 RepID=UPI0037A2520B